MVLFPFLQEIGVTVLALGVTVGVGLFNLIFTFGEEK